MKAQIKNKISKDILLKAFRLMMEAKAMADTYENNRKQCQQYR